MYASVVSAAKNRSASSRLVASSMNTISAQRGPRPSNQSCGEPSTCTSSPSRGRRSRLWWTTASRRPFGRHSPSSAIHFRSVSRDTDTPCLSSSFSAANVGPKSA